MQSAHHSLLSNWSLQSHSNRPTLVNAVTWQRMHTFAERLCAALELLKTAFDAVDILHLLSNYCSHVVLSKANHDSGPKFLPQNCMWCRTRGRSRTSWLRVTCTSRIWMTARPMTSCDSFLRSASCLCYFAASSVLHADLHFRIGTHADLHFRIGMHADLHFRYACRSAPQDWHACTALNCSLGAESHSIRPFQQYMHIKASKVIIIDIPIRPGRQCMHTQALKVIMLDRPSRLLVQILCLHEHTAAWLLP